MNVKVSAVRRDVGGVDLASGSDDPAGKLVTSADTPGERGFTRSGQMPERRTAIVCLTTEHGGRGTAAAPPTASRLAVHRVSAPGLTVSPWSVTIGAEVDG